MDKIRIMLDTDLGSDCDDTGALAVLHNLADKGKAEILSVTHCGSEISGAVAVKAINEWYKREEIPIGRYDKGVFLEEEDCKIYTQPLMQEYLKNHSMPSFEGAVKVMRRTLAENNDVTMVVIGMLNNIAELLKSDPDEISSLNGVELVKNSVKNMYVMGGDFQDLSYSEWNIKLDIKSAQYVSENFPKPIIYCGFELGVNVLTGVYLKSEPNENPVRFSYSRYPRCSDGLRSSWDPITVYCAVNQENPFFTKSENCNIGFDDEGKVKIKGGGKDCYLIAISSEDEVQKTVDMWLH